MDIKHPAYELERGVPTRATIGRETYDLDEDGYLTVEDEDTAEVVMQRLAQTYSVEYDGDGEITATNSPSTRDDDGDGGDTDEGEAAAEAEADAQPPAEDDEDEDEDESDEDEAAATMDRSELDDWNMEALRDRYEDLDGDPNNVDMRQKDELIAGILRLQADRNESAADE